MPDILYYFDKHVQQVPHRVAVEAGDLCVTYKALDSLTGQCAVALQANRVQSGEPVALILDRSIEMMVGILGTLKAGAAWLPISFTDPDERVKKILEDSAAPIVITKKKFAEKFGLSTDLLLLDNMKDPNVDVKSIAADIRDDSLAYVIYTSGSTGMPKGVMIEHHSLLNRLIWMQQQYPIGECDTILQKTPYTFDVSVWELLWWAISGSRCCFLAPGMEKFPMAIADVILAHRVTVIHFVPSMLQMFLYYVEKSDRAQYLASLHICFCSGEALKTTYAEQFYALLTTANGTRLTNLYGPTETTIDVTWFDLQYPPPPVIPIGLPIINIQAWVIENGKEQSVEQEGELWITGRGVARGYLNRVELTAERFPVSAITNYKRAYRTGDRVKRLPDHTIQYLGRIDHQVKVHGIRIELGEIEAALNIHPQVKDCFVIVHTQTESIALIKAFYVAEAAISSAQLKTFLEARLPNYMIPKEFVFLSNMPITSNGKADRAMLLQLGRKQEPEVKTENPS